ncbi:GNAT family N-acetyltransferase [Phormidium tenue]|uniref:GNAT family N-acetyltransferase n=1 Tax=Phormidium tenue NIES-30 TaxID=549789 RepID=A0A1U7IZD0_9CYAN|nr:GNAT family N-acetyltransferase [Phormidium tenue]MBD2234510.1 GNAT family N-acetyltransferase [Phormidium tenue FACHB-1052]OKH44403.1 GNAT family N-acetyltransferase [Phormidium tenue NIES-30]
MQIRPGQATDSGAIAALLTDLGYPVTAEFVTHSLQRQLPHADAAILVAVEQDTVVGLISLHFIPQLALPGDFCRISYFCIAPGARGQGIGTALETAASELAWARGCDRIEVHCHSRREQAHRFYNRQGYIESPKYLIKSA